MSRAVEVTRSLTWVGVKVSLAFSARATAPAVNGVAIEVPEAGT